MTTIEPTPEDYEAARKELARDPAEIFLGIEARWQARMRIAREQEERERLRRERRMQLFRRLLPFRR